MSLFNEFLEVNGVEFRKRVAAKEPFTDEEMEVLLNNSIQEEITDVRRWTFSVRHILHIEEKFYELSYSEPKTEMSGDRDYYPSLITEVWPHEKTIIEYKRKGLELFIDEIDYEYNIDFLNDRVVNKIPLTQDEMDSFTSYSDEYRIQETVNGWFDIFTYVEVGDRIFGLRGRRNIVYHDWEYDETVLIELEKQEVVTEILVEK